MSQVKYITIGCDSDYTTHVIRIGKTKDESQIVATFNKWWSAIRYANALNFPSSKKGI